MSQQIIHHDRASIKPHFMGIDGGGSHLRVVVVDDDLEIIARVERQGVNPGGIGRDRAAEIVQDAMQLALAEVNVSIDAVGIGIAGASVAYAETWLRGIVASVLPQTFVVPSSDLEIALVGFHGCHDGILVLAGTGSGAFGVDTNGASFQIGGWGYLLGDEGSGYWIGMEALRHVTRYADGLLLETTRLPEKILEMLHLESARSLIQWVYGQDRIPVKDVAKLATLVMELAMAGDTVAHSICDRAAQHLAQLATVTRDRAAQSELIGFAGGILSTPNVISQQVADHLNLDAFPIAKFEPVVGAALLAKIQWLARTHKGHDE